MFNNPATPSEIDVQLLFFDKLENLAKTQPGKIGHPRPTGCRGNHQVLPAGTVYTNEPGLYQIDNFGVRIEDDVLVTADGHRVLGRPIPKTVAEVEATMAAAEEGA